jgi:hypothetical protein
MNLNPFKRKPKPLQIQRMTASEMRLADWRAIPSLVTEAQKLALNPAYQQMLAVLKTESPANFALPSLGPQPSDRIAYLGKIEGYQLCLNHLELLAKPDAKTTKHVEATFEPTQPLPDQI